MHFKDRSNRRERMVNKTFTQTHKRPSFEFQSEVARSATPDRYPGLIQRHCIEIVYTNHISVTLQAVLCIISSRLSVAIKITKIRSPTKTSFLFIFQLLDTRMPSVLITLIINDEHYIDFSLGLWKLTDQSWGIFGGCHILLNIYSVLTPFRDNHLLYGF